MSQDYYERQEARRERYELRAERARQESDAAARQAEKIASIIPMGQPILVGHHSEERTPLPLLWKRPVHLPGMRRGMRRGGTHRAL